jgi:YfiH family protein
VLTSPILESLPWLEHGFGTRQAPLSQDGMASLKQIHSSLSLVADRREGCVGEGDALVTGEAGITVSIRTADCLPILLADPVGRAVAAIHAGWRGTHAHIVTETIGRMRSEFGSEAAKLVAAIGPGIGPCCYEVGEDVARLFGMERAGRLDLASANVSQLIDAGVPRDQIGVSGRCTFCDPVQFYSWRRDHDRAGRMISFIGVLHTRKNTKSAGTRETSRPALSDFQIRRRAPASRRSFLRLRRPAGYDPLFLGTGCNKASRAQRPAASG